MLFDPQNRGDLGRLVRERLQIFFGRDVLTGLLADMEFFVDQVARDAALAEFGEFGQILSKPLRAATVEPAIFEIDFDQLDEGQATNLAGLGQKRPKIGGRGRLLPGDCTPVWDAMDFSQLAIGGQLVYEVPVNLGGPRFRGAPMIRYDASYAAPKLRYLEAIIERTGIHKMILWKHKLEILEDGFRRDTKYRVLGTIRGAAFWN